jgi:hypothetical protein
MGEGKAYPEVYNDQPQASQPPAGAVSIQMPPPLPQHIPVGSGLYPQPVQGVVIKGPVRAPGATDIVIGYEICQPKYATFSRNFTWYLRQSSRFLSWTFAEVNWEDASSCEQVRVTWDQALDQG